MKTKKPSAQEQVEALHKKYEYYEYANEDFNKFLEQCKRAVNKVSGYKCSVKHDFWSTCVKWSANWRECRTYWDVLRETGSLSVNDGIFCIDFQADCHVFAGYSASYYIEQGLATETLFKEFMDEL
jgi:hypothetical protein